MTDYHTCKKFHDSCINTNLDKLIATIKYTLKVYSAVHGAPIILFSKKRKELLNNPKETIIKFIKKILASMSFLGTFIMIMRSSMCLFRFKSKLDIINIIFWCLFSTIGVLVEDPKRAEDYAVFTFPRVIEGVWDLLRKLGYVKDIPHASKVIFAVSMALLLVSKVHFTKEMPESYRNQLSFIFGKEDNELIKKENN